MEKMVDIQSFRREISSIPTEQVLDSELDRLALGTDASFYRLVPALVVKVRLETEVQILLLAAQKSCIPLTFRTAGTSLSGQAVTSGVLVYLPGNWDKWALIDEGEAIKLQPGVIGGRVNAFLKKINRKIGPDPASIDSAMIGGIVANNASGMCCGTAQNSYRTVQDVRLILSDGTVLDTSSIESKQSFQITHANLLQGLSHIREDILGNDSLCAKIRRKYKIKNTTGYGLNSFVDFEDPIEILKHIIVGSEGTLAFISEVTLKTVKEAPLKACALVIFKSIEDACRATIRLKNED
jgi:D-lactate dehydrogenase